MKILMWKRHTIGALIAIFLATPATAYTYLRAEALHKLCQSQQPAEQAMMIFYVRGALDQINRSAAVIAWQLRIVENREPDLDKAEVTARTRLGFCVPRTVNNEVIERAFCSHLGAHPEKLQSPAMHVFIDAMAETWPCQ